MLAFALALFPPTAVFGTGQFVQDKGFRSWLGWTQLATLIAQVVVLALLRQSIVQHSEIITATDILREPEEQYLVFAAITLLLFGVGLYLAGIWRTVPTAQPLDKPKKYVGIRK